MNRKLSLLLASLMTLSFAAPGVRAADKPAEPVKSEAQAPAAEKAAPAAAPKADAAKSAKDKKKARHVHTRDQKHL